ncbi:MAG: chemotaxis protein CheW, partial [Cyanobacteria bacterium J06639_1]
MPLSLDSALTIARLDPLTLDPPPEEYRQRLLSFPLGGTRNSSMLLDRISEIVRVDAANIL